MGGCSAGVRAFIAVSLVFATGCPMGPYTVQYKGSSGVERRLLAVARRDVYPDDVRAAPEQYRDAMLAWPGIVTSAQPDASDPAMVEVVIAHHYWDWIEDHSIQKAKAFLSPRGEGEFVCHASRDQLPAIDFKAAMAITYVRPVGMKDGRLHAACVLALHPPDWYLTDVFEYGRNGEGMRVLRVHMK